MLILLHNLPFKICYVQTQENLTVSIVYFYLQWHDPQIEWPQNKKSERALKCMKFEYFPFAVLNKHYGEGAKQVNQESKIRNIFFYKHEEMIC